MPGIAAPRTAALRLPLFLTQLLTAYPDRPALHAGPPQFSARVLPGPAFRTPSLPEKATSATPVARIAYRPLARQRKKPPACSEKCALLNSPETLCRAK